MRILYVAAGFPFPPRRGYLNVAYHHIRWLAQRHEVHLVAFATAESDLDGATDLRQACNQIRVVKLVPWLPLLTVMARAATREPMQVSYFRSPEMAALVDERLRNERYDAVIFQMTRMAQYRPGWYKGLTVLDMVDPLALSYERSLRWRPWFLRALVREEVTRLIRYERQHARTFDRVLLIARADIEEYARMLPDARFEWVPYGVELDQSLSPSRSQRRSGTIILSGNMYYEPNIQGVDYFCRHVLPIVHKRAPEARLQIVGARPSRSVRKWAAHPAVEVTGHVPDIQHYLRQSMVSVCPVQLQVGIQTKVLEALASGTPVVTTSAGNNGVGGQPGKHLFVANDPAEFADRVLQLLGGDQWDVLSENGRTYVAKHFNWDNSSARLESILQDCLSSSYVDAERSSPLLVP